MKHLTIRNLSEELAEALEKERRRRNWSLTRTVKELLKSRLGIGHEKGYDNGLGELAGSWSHEELREFEEATALFEAIDEEFWK